MVNLKSRHDCKENMKDSRSEVAEIQTALNDFEIREALIRKLTNQKPKPRAIVEELRVHNGNAIADVVTLHSEAHCYEIKGCNDKIGRISTQGKHYDKVFRKITLVTTERNLKPAMRISPHYWGVIIARSFAGGVKFSHIRRAKLNQNFNKEIAAKTLWKSEMLKIVKGKPHQNKPRDYLAKLIAETKHEFELSVRICDLLVGRQRKIRSQRQTPESRTM